MCRFKFLSTYMSTWVLVSFNNPEQKLTFGQSVTFLFVNEEENIHRDQSWPIHLFAGWLHTVGSSFATRSRSSSVPPARKRHERKSASSSSSHRCQERWHESCRPAAAERQQCRCRVEGEDLGNEPLVQHPVLGTQMWRMPGLPLELMPNT